MNKLFLNKKPIIYALILLVVVSLMNYITHIIFIKYQFVSLNYILSVGFYGSILFPIYYVLTYVLFFVSILLLETKAKKFIYIFFILYAIFSVPFISLDSMKFYY